MPDDSILEELNSETIARITAYTSMIYFVNMGFCGVDPRALALSNVGPTRFVAYGWLFGSFVGYGNRDDWPRLDAGEGHSQLKVRLMCIASRESRQDSDILGSAMYAVCYLTKVTRGKHGW